MVTALILMGALALMIQAFIGLSFLVSCIWEREKRAALFAAIQFIGMAALLLLFVSFSQKGFFRTGPGLVLLVVGSMVVCLVAYLLLRRTEKTLRPSEAQRGPWLRRSFGLTRGCRFLHGIDAFDRTRSSINGFTKKILIWKNPMPNEEKGVGSSAKSV